MRAKLHTLCIRNEAHQFSSDSVYSIFGIRYSEFIFGLGEGLEVTLVGGHSLLVVLCVSVCVGHHPLAAH